MPTEIKICGLNTIATVDAALVAGADCLGFVVFPKSPRNVTPAEARALATPARGRAKIRTMPYSTLSSKQSRPTSSNSMARNRRSAAPLSKSNGTPPS
jgi:phosphoribosylanthranilate isomerase